jgi:non-canonical purine NTP pyrophosphatase (RdgB/HAM1 family)
MDDITFITGNAHKAEYLAKWLNEPIAHKKLDLEEIQSLDSHEVTAHKARQAYEILKTPVLVEDVALTFTAMGRLPGTYIKWFLEELGLEGLCKLADGLEHRGAECAIVYALFDGEHLDYFEARQKGSIAETPKGTGGFGWNAVFIPDGSALTYGEMDEDTIKQWSIRAHAIEKLIAYLKSHAA